MSRDSRSPEWGLEGLRFIVMCWYVPGRNVRAQREQQAGMGAGLGYSPPSEPSAHLCPAFSICRLALTAITVQEPPLPCPEDRHGPSWSHTLRGRRERFQILNHCSRPFMSPATEHSLTTQPLLHPMPVPAGNDLCQQLAASSLGTMTTIPSKEP